MTTVTSSSNGTNKLWYCTNERLRREFFHTSASISPIQLHPEESDNSQESITSEEKTKLRNEELDNRVHHQSDKEVVLDEIDNVIIINNSSTINSGSIILPLKNLKIDFQDDQHDDRSNDQLNDIQEANDGEENESDDEEQKDLEEKNYVKKRKSNSRNRSCVKSKSAKYILEENEVEVEEEKKYANKRKFNSHNNSQSKTQAFKKITRSSTKATKRFIIQPSRPSRKSTRKSKDTLNGKESSGQDFKGRDIIVPNDELDESMDFNCDLDQLLLEGNFLVKYFEDMTYSVVECKGLKHFKLDNEPYLTFVKKAGFLEHIGVFRALKCIQNNGEPFKGFKWDYWKNPLGRSKDNEQSETNHRITTITTSNRSISRSFAASKTATRRYINKDSTQIKVFSDIPPLSSSIRSNKKKANFNNSGHNLHSSKSRLSTRSSSLHHSNNKNKESSRTFSNNKGKHIFSKPSSSSSSYSVNTNKSNNNKERHSNISLYSESEKATSIRHKSSNSSAPKSHKLRYVSEIDLMDEDTKTETYSDVTIEDQNHHYHHYSTSILTPQIPIENLSEKARINIARFNFKDPGLDKESKEKLYEEAEDELRSLSKEYRRLMKELKKLEKELFTKKIQKSHNINDENEGDDEESYTNERVE
ncbi:2390_t:CDS:10 [Entrophospora sp. SA101]|nr:2390_t:CDS:10 [Entrophospora sp. SA101]CAJ0918390.1 19808_t:CDS:10 [Entrophospora sp. SA101]